ncbi:MAG: hypothetical protein JXR83_07625 [Deltaproteobacteria bacterium]|nr:hypothetical protein [Deltaproteobacteria bacterium]
MSETLGLLLVRSGLLTREALYQALEVQRQTGRFLGSCLLALGLVTPDELRLALSQQFRIPIVNGRDVLAASPDLARDLPASVVERYRVAPFRRDGDAVAIALYDPRTADVASEISFFVGRPVAPHLCDEAVVERVIATLYPQLARPMMRLPGSAGPAAAPIESTLPAPAAEIGQPGAAPPTLIVQPPTETMQANEIVHPLNTRVAPDRRRPGEIIRPLGEISNRDFARALGLEEVAREAVPIPLTTRARPRTSVREISGARLLTVVEAAEAVFTAHTVADVAEIGVRFLRGYFDRAVVFDVREVPATPLARSGFAGTAAAIDLEQFPQLAAALASSQSFHGAAPDDEEWQRLYGLLGSAVPQAVFVAGIRDRIAPRLLFYSDLAQSSPMADVHEIALLIREITTALSMIERAEK